MSLKFTAKVRRKENNVFILRLKLLRAGFRMHVFQ